ISPSRTRTPPRPAAAAHPSRSERRTRHGIAPGRRMEIAELLVNPEAWAALVTLIVMEIVLGIDNLVFISILTNKLPEEFRGRARMIGLSGALLMRFALLFAIPWIIGLTEPVFALFDHAFSWKDLILIAGGLFLVWKSTREMHTSMNPDEGAESGSAAMTA